MKEEEIVRRAAAANAHHLQPISSSQEQITEPLQDSTSQLMWLEGREPNPLDCNPIPQHNPRSTAVNLDALQISRECVEIPGDKLLSRHEKARAKKEMLVAAEKERLAAKLKSKASLQPREGLDDEIEKLEEAIRAKRADKKTTKATLHGLNVRLARMKADRKRELKKIELRKELEGFIPYS